jgi:hypothetical protein
MKIVHSRASAGSLPAALLAASFLVTGLMSVGCAEIEKVSVDDAHSLAEARAAADEDKFAVEYQKKRKKEIVNEGGNPLWADDIAKLKKEKRYHNLWDKQRDVREQKFAHLFESLAADIVRGCLAEAKAGAGWHEIDKCVAKIPQAKYDPLKAAGVGFLAIMLIGVGLLVYKTSRKQIDPVALAASKLGIKATQERERTIMNGTYNGRQISIEASAPEAGEGSKWLQVTVHDNINDGATVVYGPLAPPHGLQLPDMQIEDADDPRLPQGYRLQLSDGASAEDLLSGDVGFQIREFDPVDVRVHDGILAASTWFLFTQPDQVVEFVDLSIAIAECYPSA